MLHIQSGRDIPSVCEQLEYHFNSTCSPVMIGIHLYDYVYCTFMTVNLCFVLGGDVDGASKTLIGIAKDRNNEWKFLIAVSHNKL